MGSRAGSPSRAASPRRSPVKAKSPVRAKSPAKKAKRKSSSNKPAAHPAYKDMIRAAISGLKQRGGSSRQAIAKYIAGNYKVGDNANVHLRLAIKRALASGVLVANANHSNTFRLAPEAKKPKAAPKRKVIAKKPAAKKAKKPKKKVAPKKKSAKKSPKKAKKPAAKAAKAKKPASKKKPAAKKPAKKSAVKKVKRAPAKKAKAKK